MGTDTTAIRFDTLESLAGLKATDRITELCAYCGGTGLYTGHTHILDSNDRPFCFGCSGTGRTSVLVSSRRASIRAAAKAVAARIAEEAAADAALVAFDAAHPGLRSWLADVEDEGGFLAKASYAGAAMSDRMVEVAERIRAERAVEAERTADVVLAEGRRVLTGVVRSVKTVDSQWGTTFKMVLDLGDDTRVYGSVPAGLFTDGGSLVGRTVTLTATVERSDRDAAFGFYSRPTKATVAA